MTKAQTPLKIGLIADSPLQQHLLRGTLEALGHQLSVNVTPERFEPSMLGTAVDLWLLELVEPDRAEELVEQVLDQVVVPVLFGGDQIPARGTDDFSRWRKKLARKLGRIEPSTAPLLDEESEPSCERLALPPVCMRESLDTTPERVWVLGASMGGPIAVREFLACLPAGLPIAFVYAQHIDPGFADVLAQGLNRYAELPVRVAKPDAQLRYGEVMILPVDEAVSFSEQAQLQYSGSPWQGAYQPSIDHVMDNLIDRFERGCGALIFSGMGEDGTQAAARYTQQGLPVWTQSSSSCVNNTMPEAIRQAGCSRYSGTPQQLARRLVAWVADDVRLNAQN